MIRLLARTFIKNHESTSLPEVRNAYGMLSGVLGIVLNIILFSVKYFSGVLTGSIAITADAFNSLSDAGSSAITLLGFKIADKHRDPEHPFGHGRVEYIAGLIVAIIIILMGFDLLKNSVKKIFAPEPIDFSLLSVVILAVSVLIKLYMALYNAGLGKKIDSVAMRATARDSLGDACATAAVLVSMLVFHFFHLNADVWMGSIVALMILWSGCSAAKETISPLLGHAPDPELVSHVSRLVCSHEEITGIHDLLVHDYGPGHLMISLHAEVRADGDLVVLHDVIDTIEHQLESELHCQAVIHMDPVAADDALTSRTRARIQALLEDNFGKEISIHDFRLIPDAAHTTITFDAVLPAVWPRSDAEMQAEICRLVCSLDDSYRAVVTIDHSYT